MSTASDLRAGSDPLVWVDSGLVTLTFDRKIVGSVNRNFATKGSYFLDADAWANKGVLLTTIDVGHGCLKIYSTHLISGGGLIGENDLIKLLVPYLDDQDAFPLQLAQLEELKCSAM